MKVKLRSLSSVRVVSNSANSVATQRWLTYLRLLGFGSALPILVLVLWQIAGYRGWIDTFFLPTPIAIWESLRGLVASGDMATHLWISINRAAAGFALGGSLGLIFGLLTGFSRKSELVLDPTVQMLRMIPHLAIAPLIILWFGFGETSKVLIIAKGAFFPLYVNTFLGIRRVDKKLFEVSRLLQFSRLQQIIQLVLPSALPNILMGLRLSLAVSWLGLVVAELIGSQSGVGFLINLAKQSSLTEQIFVGVIVFAIVGMIVDQFVRYLERRLLKWRDNYKG
ncbi:ABC transporter permease [Paenibacillus sp. JCM 10914]|uniref:ABC transporter permease n=1 Tax=Paenibacillus sp. JCM 10914 TaxID=1236974 RepID=UPI0003CC9385|nr:ABC transporter permease [Paenibacillus sp. JCM 10914]GAE07748.1 alkanesulfonates transport system permease protein [Paenibacillus sp. JCM 10914]